MVNYICANSKCKREVVKEFLTRSIRCPHCGSKVLKKKKTGILKPILAR